MSKVLITGGCGFIGSHIVLLLLEEGYEVIILDSNFNSSSNVINKIFNILKKKNIFISNKLKFFKGDVRNKETLEKIFLESNFKGGRIKSVIHLSGLKSVENQSYHHRILGCKYFWHY